jgi:hypothetical protein
LGVNLATTGMEPQHIISIDEHQTEAGEGSSGHDRLAITMVERLNNLMEEGDETRAVEHLRTNHPQAKIQKVIFLLRGDEKCFVKYFEPRVASLGPIHHGNPKYQLGEKYKRKLAYVFVQADRGKRLKLLHEVVKKIKELRECFEEEVTKKYGDESLAWILFVDGCAILQYIFCAANNMFKEFNIKNDTVPFFLQDLFLLENQVPYRLLNLLMSLSVEENELRRSIDNFIRIFTYQQTDPESQQNINEGESSHDSQTKPEEREVRITEPTHLLDLLRTNLLGPLQSFIPKGPKPSSGKMCRKKKDQDPDWQLYRNVQELKAVGIQLKRSENSYLTNISFGGGYLRLPPITVDESTGPKFMNLIAYEMSPDFENNFGISSYISFLDSLIKEANDVKDLGKAGILLNFLGSDQKVADFINEIGTKSVPDVGTYMDVKIQIQAYYKNNIYYILFKLKTWIDEVIRVHFSSPWAILGLLAASSALVLTAIQTWYTVYSPPGPCDDFCQHRP